MDYCKSSTKTGFYEQKGDRKRILTLTMPIKIRGMDECQSWQAEQEHKERKVFKMLDKNGRDIKMGDIVRVENGYFKNSNGLFFVEGENKNSLWLVKIAKNGKISVNSKASQSWPLKSYCGDRSKNHEASAHNKANATIELVEDVNTFYIVKRFEESLDTAKNRLDYWNRDNKKEDAAREEKHIAELEEAIARIAEYAEQPKEKEPEKGVRFYWNGIKVDGGRLIPCGYSIDGESVTIYAKNYKKLPREYFEVVNNSDSMTDYFEDDRTTLKEKHPLYRFARYAALKGMASGKTYRRMTEEQAKEWDLMKNPGHPTQKDYDKIAELRLAEVNAKKEAERQKELEERERVLRERAEGRRYIEQVASENPIKDGEPVVTICWSEHPAFYSWEDDELKLSVAAAEIILKHYDERKHAEQPGYDKTKFIINWIDAETGEQEEYKGRYDLGDNDGGLIEHIRSFGRWYRTPDQYTGKELENPEQELSGTEKFADWLETFTRNTRIIDVEIAPVVIDFVKAKKAAEQEKAKQEAVEIFATVAMLTDEQVESAIFAVNPNDETKADVARFFLQELARRDKKRAIDVFNRWKEGA